MGASIYRRPAPAIARLLVLAFAICGLFVGCSKNTEPEQILPAALSVTPNTGAPGTIVRIGKLDISRLDVDSLRVYFGDKMAPVILSGSGTLISSIPLFLDESGAHTPPAKPVDVVVQYLGTDIGRAGSAVTVLPLPQAPGAASEVAEEMRSIVGALADVMSNLVPYPSEEEQYLVAMIAALDSLLYGTDESSLPAALNAVGAEPDQLAILEGLLAAMNADNHLAQVAAQLQSIADDLHGMGAQSGAFPSERMGDERSSPQESSFAGLPLESGANLAPAALNVSDDLLALKMQFYVIAAEFGAQVIAETGQTFSETVGLGAGLIGIARGVPQVEATILILAYLDFVVNKIIIGLLPADLDAIDLSMAQIELGFFTETEATITVRASNDPPQISLQDMIGQILTLMGLSGSSQGIESFRDALIKTANYFLTTMQSVIAAYASAHPELNLDVDLFAAVPDITWKATAANPVYYDLKTFTPNIIEPLMGDLNWVTKDKVGIGRIYLMPSSSEDARLLPGYYGGAFGNGSAASPTRSVLVGSDLELEVSCPDALEPDELGDLTVRAGYRELEGVNWTSGINITIQADGGSVTPGSGTTNSSGYFISTVEATDADAEVIKLVIVAQGEDNRFGGKTREIAVGSRLPTVRVKASNVDDRAIIMVNGAWVVDVFWGEGPGGEPIGHQPGNSGWVDASAYIAKGDNSFRFWLWNQPVCCYVSATFEVEVDGVVVVTKTFQQADSSEGVKYDEAVILTF